MPSDLGLDEQWQRVASELRAYRQEQQQAWGDVDDATLGRYLADEASPEERRRIEAALDERPELRKLTDLVSDVLRDCEPVSVPRPAVLPFRNPVPAFRSQTQRWHRWAAVAAAACLLFTLGYTVLPQGRPTPLAPLASDAVALNTIVMKPSVGLDAKPIPPNDEKSKGTVTTVWTDHLRRAVETVRDVNSHDVALAAAAGFNRVGGYCQKEGDLEKAELSYQLAYNIGEWKLGADAAPTVEARKSLGDVYQIALNTTDNLASSRLAPSSPFFTAGAGVETKREDYARNNALQLRDRITNQSVSEVKKSVVPILVQNLREAQRPQDGPQREQLGRALAELGPAAREAVPVLEESLRNAKTPREQEVVLKALGELGPTAGPAAAKVLVPALNSPYAEARHGAEDALAQYGPAGRDLVMHMADGAEAEQAEWKRLKERMKGAEGRIGVRDVCELFSPHALKQGQKAIRELASKSRVEVFAETIVTAAKDDDKATKDRVREIHVNGVYFVIHPSPVSVEVYVGASLRDAGFGGAQQERLRQLVEAEAKRQDYDQALLKGVEFVAQFQADKAKPANP